MSSTEETPPLAILYHDAWLVAVSKPAGIPVQPDPTGDKDLLTLTRELLKDPSLELVHRIDRPVSGVVLFACDREALAQMNVLFRERRVEKKYWAIVEGHVGQKEGAKEGVLLEHVLEHDPKARRARVKEKSGVEPDRTRVRVLSVGDRYALLEAVPEGGAFHQIRSQLAVWGHPIKGDVKYGARRGEKDRSIALHARSLHFQHPMTDITVHIEAPPPAAPPWSALLAKGGLV